MYRKLFISAVLALIVAGCGNRTEDRAISGAGIGTAAGLAIGAVTGLTLVEGALIGAGVGGITGALTDSEDFDLGIPWWRRGSSDSAAASSSGDYGGGSSVASTQAALTNLGYDPGPIDGAMGPRTRAAISAYQRDHGLSITGRPSAQLSAHMNSQLGNRTASAN